MLHISVWLHRFFNYCFKACTRIENNKYHPQNKFQPLLETTNAKTDNIMLHHVRDDINLRCVTLKKTEEHAHIGETSSALQDSHLFQSLPKDPTGTF